MPQLVHDIAAVFGAGSFAVMLIKWTGLLKWSGWRLLGAIFAGGAAPVQIKLTERRLSRLERIAEKPLISVGDILMAGFMALFCSGAFVLIVFAHRFPAVGAPSLPPASGLTAMLILLLSGIAFMRAIESYHELCNHERMIEQARSKLARLSVATGT